MNFSVKLNLTVSLILLSNHIYKSKMLSLNAFMIVKLKIVAVGGKCEDWHLLYLVFTPGILGLPQVSL